MIVHGVLSARRTTRIFARATEGGECLVVFDFDFSCASPVTVVVPLPLLPGGHVSFVDLGKVPALFDDLDEHFALPRRRHDDDDDEVVVVPRVERAGGVVSNLAASFADLDDVLQRGLDGHDDDAFAVFRFAAGSGHPPPLGLRYLARDGALHFPTRQVSDGAANDVVTFDHVLYVQGLPLATGWHKSRKKTDARTAPQLIDIVADGSWLRRRRIVGPHVNEDVVVGLALPTLSPRPALVDPLLDSAFIERLGAQIFAVTDNDDWGLDDEDDSLDAVFNGLEHRLLDPRSQLAAARGLLAPDYQELSAAGLLGRAEAPLALEREDARPASDRHAARVLDLRASPLNDNLVLVTWATANSRRSSLWTKSPAGWRLRFHHRTPRG